MVMKKICSFGLLLLILMIALMACDSGQEIRLSNSLESTDLSGVEIEGMKIGISIEDVDLSRFTNAENRYADSEYSYHFMEVRIAVDENGMITKIHGTSFKCYDKQTTRAFSQGSSKIDETISVLGNNFNNYWFDREQQIRANTYIDNESGISLTITYASYSSPPSSDGQLIWVILAEK